MANHMKKSLHKKFGSNKYRNFFFYFTGSILFLLIHTSILAEVKSQPNSIALLVGSWQVSDVHVDTGATRRLSYQYNDFRLKGRIVTVGVNEISSDFPEKEICTGPKLNVQQMTTAKLIAKSMAGRGIEPMTPTARDFKFPIQGDILIDVISFKCREGLFAGSLGVKDGVEGAWIVLLSSNQLAMHWYGETILVLNRVPTGAAPRPSFNCKDASLTVEKAICSSFALSSFDSSLAEAYAFGLKRLSETRDGTEINVFREEQQQWMKVVRNVCGSDPTCLKKVMEKRLESLMELN